MSTSLTAISTASTTTVLVKMASGEYTAASVSSDQKDALKLALVKEPDGNYGTSAPATPPAAKSTSAVQTALINLTLGG